MTVGCCGEFTNGHYDDNKCALVRANRFIKSLQDARDRHCDMMCELANAAASVVESLDDGRIGEQEIGILRAAIAKAEGK